MSISELKDKLYKTNRGILFHQIHSVSIEEAKQIQEAISLLTKNYILDEGEYLPIMDVLDHRLKNNYEKTG